VPVGLLAGKEHTGPWCHCGDESPECRCTLALREALLCQATRLLQMCAEVACLLVSSIAALLRQNLPEMGHPTGCGAGIKSRRRAVKLSSSCLKQLHQLNRVAAGAVLNSAPWSNRHATVTNHMSDSTNIIFYSTSDNYTASCRNRLCDFLCLSQAC
jgi:hypothetical protein